MSAVLHHVNARLFGQVVAAAHAAGEAAVAKLAVRPMVVSDGVQQWYVEDGACGFAWVKVRPGNSAFAKYVVKNCGARKSYNGGVDIWCHAYNQSMQKKEAYCQAWAEVVREKLDISCYADSRMD